MQALRSTPLLLSLLVTILYAVSGCVVDNSSQVIAEKHRDGVFIHVSHGPEAPQRVAMALSMAEKMSEDRDVLVYFDITGVQVVLNDSVDIAFGQFASSKTQLKKLLEKGVGLYVCPGCLQAAGKSGADVLEGVEIAEKEAFFDFTKGRILSLDY